LDKNLQENETQVILSQTRTSPHTIRKVKNSNEQNPNEKKCSNPIIPLFDGTGKRKQLIKLLKK
jgi:hypothetical protein